MCSPDWAASASASVLVRLSFFIGDLSLVFPGRLLLERVEREMKTMCSGCAGCRLDGTIRAAAARGLCLGPGCVSSGGNEGGQRTAFDSSVDSFVFSGQLGWEKKKGRE